MVTTALLQCLTYQCAYPALPQGVCIDRNDSRYLLYPCPVDLPYCPVDFYGAKSACTAEPEPTALPAYIGDSCSVQSPCMLGVCTAGVCTGRSERSKCSSHEQCGLGLRCVSGSCAPLLPAEAWGCRADEDCELASGCNALQGVWNGTCVPFYSIGNGGIVTACLKGQSPLCHSGYCLSNNEKYPAFHCIDAPASVLAMPATCTKDEDCKGQSYPWTFHSTCECGYTATGTAYCTPLPGDPSGLALTQSLRELAARIRGSGCHTVRRWQDDCLRKMDSALFQEYERNRLLFSLYAKFQGNDVCVKRILTREYWSWSRSLSIGLVLVSVLA